MLEPKKQNIDFGRTKNSHAEEGAIGKEPLVIGMFSSKMEIMTSKYPVLAVQLMMKSV